MSYSSSYNRKQFERYLTEKEERQLFNHIGQFADVLARRDFHWMGLMRQTGLRVKPMSLFSVDDARCALASGYVVVRADTNKRGQPHKVLANKKAIKHLKALLAIRLEMGFAPVGDEPLIMSRNRNGLSVRTFQERMRTWCAAAGLTVEASPHWFRHTLAKRLVSRSTSANPLAVVQVALGHRSIASTGVYTMPDKEDMAASMEAAS